MENIVMQYRGARLAGAKKLFAVMLIEGQEKAWGKLTLKAAQRYAVGDYITVDVERGENDEVETIYTDTMRFASQAKEFEEEAVLEWTARDKADRTELKARNLKKDRDALVEALRPVREIYLRQVGDNRTAMLAVILQGIGAR